MMKLLLMGCLLFTSTSIIAGEKKCKIIRKGRSPRKACTPTVTVLCEGMDEEQIIPSDEEVWYDGEIGGAGEFCYEGTAPLTIDDETPLYDPFDSYDEYH